MFSKAKNIIILVVVALALIFAYFFFIKGDGEEASLSYSIDSTAPPIGIDSGSNALTQDFLYLLLNVRNIRLEDAIFSDLAFINLRDSSITLIPDGTEGRPNPFAPIGIDFFPQAPLPASFPPAVLPPSALVLPPNSPSL